MADGTVEELKHFPFPTFASFRGAVEAGEVTLSVLPNLALEWAYKSNYSSRLLTWSLPVPYVFLIVLIGHAAIVRALLVPVGIAGWFATWWLCRPGLMHRAARLLATAIWWIAFAVLVVAGGFWMSMTFLIGTVLTRLSQYAMYRNVVNALLSAAIADEALLCHGWSIGWVKVLRRDGSMYDVLGTMIDGNYSSHSDTTIQQLWDQLAGSPLGVETAAELRGSHGHEDTAADPPPRSPEVARQDGTDDEALRESITRMETERTARIAHWSAIVAADHDNWRAWYELGMAHAAGLEHDLALMAYSTVVRLNPEFWEAWLAIGHVYSRKAQPEDAIAAFRTAITHGPDFATVHGRLGHHGHSGEAARAFAAAAKSLR